MNKSKIYAGLDAWRRSWAMRFTLLFNMVPMDQHLKEKHDLKVRNADISRICAKLEIENSNLKEQNEELKRELGALPFDFKELLKCYNITKLNALVYRIINNTRNNPATVDYLNRWKERIENALTTLTEGSEEEIE